MPLTTYAPGDVLTAASLNANLVFAAANPTGGLSFVNATTFTAASTVSLPLNSFTATYRNYRVLWEVSSGSTDITITGRLRAAGSDLTGANYNGGCWGLASNGASLLFADANQTSAKLGMAISSAGINQSMLVQDFISPQLSDKTIWTSNAFYQASSAGERGVNTGGHVYDVATAADSFTIICNTGNITGVCRVYGYADS